MIMMKILIDWLLSMMRLSFLRNCLLLLFCGTLELLYRSSKSLNLLNQKTKLLWINYNQRLSSP